MRSVLLRIVVFISALTSLGGCKYYQYHPNRGIEEEKYQRFLTNEWRRIDHSYVLVLHTAVDTVEFYDLIYNENEEELIGYVRPLEGLSLYHYKRAVHSPQKKFKRPFSGVDGPASNQLHFFVNSCTQLDSTVWKFNINEIEDMSSIRQAKINTWINLTFIPVIYVTAAAVLQGMIMLSWE